MFGNKFDYLRLSERTVKEIEHDDIYIKEGVEMTAYRRIYQDVEYDNFEKREISKMKEVLSSQRLTIFTDDVILRFLYAGYFNLTNTFELYKRYLYWINTSNIQTIPPRVLNCLEEGLIYIGGKDYQFRPIVVINLHLLDLYLFDSDTFIHALSIILIICEEYLFYPGKVENIVVIIETNNIALHNFPVKSFQVVLWMISQNFPQLLDRMYIFNPPKDLIDAWEFNSQYIDARTLKKIEMWDSKTFAPIAHGFNPEMFEQKFGGTMKNITQYWMPLPVMQQPTGVKYNISKPPPQQGTIQYSLFNDPHELMQRLEQRAMLDKSESHSIISEKKTNFVPDNLHLHEPMGAMFQKEPTMKNTGQLEQSQNNIQRPEARSEKSSVRSQQSYGYGAPALKQRQVDMSIQSDGSQTQRPSSNVQACIIY